jgi:two-component system, LytTR family, sensor kinase
MQQILDWYFKFYPTRGVSKSRRIAIHITYWVVWGLFISLSLISQPTLANRLGIAFFTVIQSCIIYYGIAYLVFPNLLSKKRFIIGLLLLFLVYFLYYSQNLVAYIWAIKFNFFIPNSYMYKYAQAYINRGVFGAFKFDNFFFEIYSILNSVVLPFLLKFSRVITNYSLRVERLSKEKADLEIDFLRTQLNPHFLLNSLNNIYSQVICKDETAGDSIVVLSDLMKYILYNSGEAQLDLDREIHFLRDYVDLEKLRGNRYLKIHFSQEGEMRGYNIAPLILINYVENAFKHGGAHEGEIASIDIDIKFIDETLFLRIENDFVEKMDGGNKTKEGGIGIGNTRRRLKLLYPNRHSLIIKKDNNKFLVEIMIKLVRV